MKNRYVAVLCVLCAAAVFFTGCGGKKETGAAKRSPTEFVIGNGTEIQSIDPAHIEGVPEHRVYDALFEPLVQHGSKTGAPEPAVAESWSISDDGTVITFRIRPGIVWSDGTPITAQTVVDSWMYILNPTTASKYAYMPSMVVKGANGYNTQGGRPEDVGIRAVDDSTVEITLVGNVPYVLDLFTHYSFAILPMHAITKYGDNWIKKENFVCNGPFTLQEWIPNDRLVLVPNDKYWNRENVFLTKLTFLPIEDTNTAYQSFKNGEIDWSCNPPVALIDQLKLDPAFQVAPQLSTYFLYINLNHPVLKDARIRKALSMAVDRQELVDKVTKGGQVPALTVAVPVPGYTPPAGNGYNVAEAKRLLAEAGYPDGQGFPALSYMYNTLELHKAIGEYLQQAWKTNLGIDISLQNLEWATFLEERKTSRMEIGRAGWVGDYMDPNTFLELFISTGGNNDGHYNSPQYDALLRQAAAMPGGPERNEVLRQAEDLLINQEQVIVPLYFYVSQNLIDLTQWDGWFTNPKDQHLYVGLKHK
jgi:oligopeptide transport system substrate-binding protein